MASQYNLEGLKDGKPLAREEGGQGSAGLYRHPESGQEAIVQTDPLFGNAQANAFIRLGFRWVRDAKPEEIHSLPELLQEQENKSASNLQNLTAAVVEQNKYLAGQLEQQRKDREQVPQDATDISGERARQSAADQATVRDQAHGEVAVTNQGDMVKVDGLTPAQEKKAINDGPLRQTQATDAPERVGFGAPKNSDSKGDEEENAGGTETDEAKPLSQQNRTELNQTALAEGVENPEQYNTKKELVEAIEAKQSEGKADEEEGDDSSDGEPATSPEEPLNDEGEGDDGDEPETQDPPAGAGNVFPAGDLDQDNDERENQ